MYLDTKKKVDKWKLSFLKIKLFNLGKTKKFNIFLIFYVIVLMSKFTETHFVDNKTGFIQIEKKTNFTESHFVEKVQFSIIRLDLRVGISPGALAK